MSTLPPAPSNNTSKIPKTIHDGRCAQVQVAAAVATAAALQVRLTAMQLDNPVLYFVKLYNTATNAAARAIPTSRRHFPRRRGGAPLHNSLEAAAVTLHVPSSQLRPRQ